MPDANWRGVLSLTSDPAQPCTDTEPARAIRCACALARHAIPRA